MELRPQAVQQLLTRLKRLPGIGPRSAQSMVEHLLTAPRDEVMALASALGELHDSVRLCSICSLLTENDPCVICADPERDRSIVLVIEEPTTAWSVESTHEFRGLYHALMGHLSPLHGIGPDDLTIEALIERVNQGEIREVILATDPTVEGETTALFIARRLESHDVEISRPASGIPVGGELAAVDQLTLAQALKLRRQV